MISEEALEIIECAVTNDKHFINEPLSLSCGHSVCKNCLDDVKYNKIKCIKCGEMNKFIVS